MILCVHCIANSMRDRSLSNDAIRNAATVIDGKALCANHLVTYWPGIKRGPEIE